MQGIAQNNAGPYQTLAGNLGYGNPNILEQHQHTTTVRLNQGLAFADDTSPSHREGPRPTSLDASSQDQ
eukprot:8606431-Karenia_brevis.AAC.1